MSSRITALIGTAAAAVLLFSSSSALAQKPVSVAETVSQTFTIEAIDHASRIITLKDENGLVDDIFCGPDVQRFDQLNVGDKVTFRYHESLVTALKHPSQPSKPAESSSVTRNPSGAPGGTMAQQTTAVVTIEAINPKTPAVTIKTADGRRMSFKVENASNLEGYKVGDMVEITYTQALAISVVPAGS